MDWLSALVYLQGAAAEMELNFGGLYWLYFWAHFKRNGTIEKVYLSRI